MSKGLMIAKAEIIFHVRGGPSMSRTMTKVGLFNCSPGTAKRILDKHKRSLRADLIEATLAPDQKDLFDES